MADFGRTGLSLTCRAKNQASMWHLNKVFFHIPGIPLYTGVQPALQILYSVLLKSLEHIRKLKTAIIKKRLSANTNGSDNVAHKLNNPISQHSSFVMQQLFRIKHMTYTVIIMSGARPLKISLNLSAAIAIH